MIEVIPASAAEMVAAWDRGDKVQSISLGGMGDGYEWAIQSAAMAIMREALNDQEVLAKLRAVPTGGSMPDDIARWMDNVLYDVDERDEDTGEFRLGGLSGSQAGAAKSMATKLLWNFDACFGSIPEDRRIFVHKNMFGGWKSPEEALLAGIEAGRRLAEEFERGA